MNFALALSIAASFWGARDMPLTCTPRVITGPPADLVLPKGEWGYPAAMGAVPSTCTIYVSSIATTYRYTRELTTLYCAYVAHEVGHLLGLPHAQSGLMTGAGVSDLDAPWDCVHWRRYAKRHAIALSSHRGRS
jgi:hypothetical protein